MENKTLITFYFESLHKVISKFSSKKYANFVIKQVLDDVKKSYDFANNISIDEQISLEGDYSKVDVLRLEKFFSEFSTLFKKKLDHHQLASTMMKDVKQMILDNYTDLEQIELDAKYFSSLA